MLGKYISMSRIVKSAVAGKNRQLCFYIVIAPRSKYKHFAPRVGDSDSKTEN